MSICRFGEKNVLGSLSYLWTHASFKAVFNLFLICSHDQKLIQIAENVVFQEGRRGTVPCLHKTPGWETVLLGVYFYLVILEAGRSQQLHAGPKWEPWIPGDVVQQQEGKQPHTGERQALCGETAGTRDPGETNSPFNTFLQDLIYPFIPDPPAQEQMEEDHGFHMWSNYCCLHFWLDSS